MRRAFVPLAILMVLSGAGCNQAPVPKPTPYAGVPLPVPPAPPRVPPRPRTSAADAAQADPGPVAEQDPAAAALSAEELPGAPSAVAEAPQAHAALQPGLAVPRPPTPAPTLASLAGLNEGEVLQRFGRPSRAAAVGQGMRWTWDVEGCEMTMTLFPDVAAQMRRVLSAELGGAARDELGEAGCLDRLGRRRAGL